MYAGSIPTRASIFTPPLYQSLVILGSSPRLILKAHVFGHIHEGYGEYLQGETRLINASTCNERYMPENTPVVLDLSLQKADLKDARPCLLLINCVKPGGAS